MNQSTVHNGGVRGGSVHVAVGVDDSWQVTGDKREVNVTFEDI